MYNINNILDTIRANASDDYQTRVPATTQANLTTIGQVITNYSPLANEFIGALVNRIAMTIVSNKIATNPLAVLKKGGVPLGTDIQEIYTNPAKAKTYDLSSSELLSNVPPDVKALYYRVNRQDKYPVTITRQMLQKAFINEASLSQLIDSIISSLYSGDNYDEFILMKNLIIKAYTSSHIKTVSIFDENVGGNNDEDIAKSLVKNIKTYSNLFTFPSSEYNKYACVKGDSKPVITWTPLEDQILILDASMSANIDVEVLSYAFNIDKSQIQTRSLNIDSFNGQPILAMLCDKSFFQVYDNLKELGSFDNADNLTIKYILHHWQTYGYSLFANAVAFTYTPLTFQAVTDIITVPTTGTHGVEVDITTASVLPLYANNRTIVWTVKSAGTTGVTTGNLATGKFTPATAGTLVLTATITNGLTASTNYVKDFTITIA